MDKFYADLAKFIKDLQAYVNTLLLKIPPEQIPPPVIPPVVVPPAPIHRSRIQDWALGIQSAEGGKPWHINMKNHNPGNLKYTSFTASLGGKLGKAATDGGYFCYFDTYEEGFKALCTFLTMAAQGKLKPYPKGITLDKFSSTYALPPNKNYVNTVAARIGVAPSIKIAELL